MTANQYQDFDNIFTEVELKMNEIESVHLGIFCLMPPNIVQTKYSDRHLPAIMITSAN